MKDGFIGVGNHNLLKLTKPINNMYETLYIFNWLVKH